MLILLWILFAELQSSHRGATKFLKHSNNLRSNVISSKRFFSTSCRSQEKGSKTNSSNSNRKTLSSVESRPYEDLYKGRGKPNYEPLWVKDNGIERSPFGPSWAKNENNRLPLPLKYSINYEIIKDPFNNRKLIKEICKGNRVVYIWTYIPSGVCLVGSSSNSVERVLSYFEKKYLFLDFRRGVQFLADYGFENIQLTLIYLDNQKFTMRDIKILEAYYISELNSSLKLLTELWEKTLKFSYNLINSVPYVGKHSSNGNDIKLLRSTSFAQRDSKPVQLTRAFSTLSQPHIKLNSLFVTGFTDAEGCFHISTIKNTKLKGGWMVKATFTINLHQKDKALLEQIKYYFGDIGNITKSGKTNIQFRVSSQKDLINIIIPHFEKFSLITQKKTDFELFKRVVEIMNRKEHLTPEGLQEIINIRASINRGLPEELKIAFPNTIPVNKSESTGDQMITDPNWLAGFTSGEGCFYIGISKSVTNKLGFQLQLKFILTQHRKDEGLIKSLIEYFKAGSVFYNGSIIEFRISNIEDLTHIIIPFFDKHQILGVKAQDYNDFKEVVGLVKNKAHLTPEGLNKISLIKIRMNRGRI
jgi:hypothetical protein